MIRLIALVALLFAEQARAAEPIYFYGAFDVAVPGSLEAGLPIISSPAAVSYLVAQKRAGVKQLDVVINSPGGALDKGVLDIVRVMREMRDSGTKIDCLITGGAASAALLVATACSTRRALADALILWHGASMLVKANTVITREMLLYMLAQMDASDNTLLLPLVEFMPKAFIDANIDREWSAAELNKLYPGFISITKEEAVDAQ